jgi:DNA-directed RNA polymerase specialized sigma24 family protein
MAASSRATEVSSDFAAFVRDVEPRLRQALVAAYGPVDGREATVDALSWAWEHWAQLEEVGNRLGYLFRVGQSAVRRFGSRPIPVDLLRAVEARVPDITPELLPSLGRLSPQQRTVVVLVHAFGWSQAEVAELLGVSASTVHEHLGRALVRLRSDLEVHDEH